MLVLLLLVTWCELLLPDPFFEPLDLPVELPAFALVVEPPVVPAVPAVPALVEVDASALAAWRSSTPAWISFPLPLSADRPATTPTAAATGTSASATARPSPSPRDPARRT